MAIFREYQLTCPGCGAEFAAHLADSLDVARAPEFKLAILERRLHRVTCSHCGLTLNAAKNFLYVDSARRLRIAITGSAVGDTYQGIDGYLSHLVHSAEALREIVVADDRDIPIGQLRLFKVYLRASDPRLHVGASDLVLDAVSEDTLTFIRFFTGQVKPVKVEISRRAMEAMLAETDGGESESASRRGWLAEKIAGIIVGICAIFDPSKAALKMLAGFARRLRSGDEIDLQADDFRKMLETLPPAARQPRWARANLDIVFAFACDASDGQRLTQLFEVRFGVNLDVRWLHNHSRHDVPALWAALRDLPDGAVEQNAMMKRLNLSEGPRGLYHEELQQIDIGNDVVDAGLATLRHCILHEVGHAAHAALDRRSDRLASAWLAREFGWRVYDPHSAQDIDDWIASMGGYPPDADLATRQEIRDLIRRSIGGRSDFVAAPIVDHPMPHPWNDRGFGPRAAFEKSGSDWWRRCDGWHAANGKRFFVSYYYQRLMEVSEQTMRFVADHAPDRYAISAPQEFFAEIFAWYYDMHHGTRSAIPRRIGNWLEVNVGAPDGFGATHVQG